jgi:hypothetical protein
VEQKSDVKYRAEKLYKNSREKFGYLIREVVSNAIHATFIREKLKKEKEYHPRVEAHFTINENEIEIVVKDNGEGFNDVNRKYFTHLDTRNPQKVDLMFHPMGQGRLAIVYFSDWARYDSVYQVSDGVYWEKSFNYPEVSLPLFDIENSKGKKSKKNSSETILTLKVNSRNALRRANTFFRKHSDVAKVKNWFIENFFPFFIENEKLKLIFSLNGDVSKVSRESIENHAERVDFELNLDESSEKSVFILWLIKKNSQPKTKNFITCFARHLGAEIEHGRLEYEIDLNISYDWFLTSGYFDDNVDQKGDKIEITIEDLEKIQNKLTTTLDKHFELQIKNNRSESKKNIQVTGKKYPSLSLFMEDESEITRKILKEADLVSDAIDKKSKAEKRYWINSDADTEDAEKLLNSSLHIYIDHRKRVLYKLKEIINKFDNDGLEKRELEDDIHDLFLKRGESLRTSTNKNHLHNLWVLDDKYTIFSETFGSISTRRGQGVSDIYIWADDPERPKELLILELKSPSNAHNAGSKYESMVAQIKKYASQFYQDPQKVLNWSVAPSGLIYFGIILARKNDVFKEVRSNNVGGKPTKIPFLDASYFFNDQFSIDQSNTTAPRFFDIRIEMYSYEDIYQLATCRNEVFFRLLQGEFAVETEEIEDKQVEESST